MSKESKNLEEKKKISLFFSLSKIGCLKKRKIKKKEREKLISFSLLSFLLSLSVCLSLSVSLDSKLKWIARNSQWHSRKGTDGFVSSDVKFRFERGFGEVEGNSRLSKLVRFEIFFFYRGGFNCRMEQWIGIGWNEIFSVYFALNSCFEKERIWKGRDSLI